LFAVMGLAVALNACSPIESWRDITGVSKNDPDPVNAPFTQNLADAETAPYPNLAGVPPPPTRATTVAERQKLAQNLVADRAAAESAGRTAVAPAPAPPRGEPARVAGTAASPAASSLRGAPATAGAAPAAAPAAASLTTPPSLKTASASREKGPVQTGRRATNQPPEPSPRDSTLEMPDVTSLPEPEASRPAPPPPGLAAAPRPVIAPEPPAPLASATPRAAPPVPDMTPAPAAPPAGKPASRRGPAVTTVATLAGAEVANRQDQAEIARVAALYKEQPGSVRVIARAAAPAAGGDPLASYQAALDRAQAVAKALAVAGVPAGKIQTEATPAASGTGRVEIQLGPDAAVEGARR
jgi:hypothetical protein